MELNSWQCFQYNLLLKQYSSCPTQIRMYNRKSLTFTLTHQSCGLRLQMNKRLNLSFFRGWNILIRGHFFVMHGKLTLTAVFHTHFKKLLGVNQGKIQSPHLTLGHLYQHLCHIIDHLKQKMLHPLLLLAHLSRRLIGELRYTHAPASVVVHHFQMSFPLKPLCQSKPNFMWSLLGKRERKFI